MSNGVFIVAKVFDLDENPDHTVVLLAIHWSYRFV